MRCSWLSTACELCVGSTDVSANISSLRTIVTFGCFASHEGTHGPTDTNGRRDAYVEPNQPLDPTKDKRLPDAFYSAIPSPVDGSIWGTQLGFPGAVIRLSPGTNPPETALAEVAKAAGPGNAGEIFARPSISVKLSALHPRYEEKERQRVLGELKGRVLKLARQAKAANLGLTIDAEEARMTGAADGTAGVRGAPLALAVRTAPRSGARSSCRRPTRAWRSRAPSKSTPISTMPRASGTCSRCCVTR